MPTKPRKKKTFNWKSMLRNSSRRIWMWSPMRKEAIKAARVGGGCVACAECGEVFKENAKPKGYQVDHTVPASEPAALIHSWDDFLTRLMVPSHGLKILCKPCHESKTIAENSVRVRKVTKTKKSPRCPR